MPYTAPIPPELQECHRLIYQPNQLVVTQFKQEQESQEYAACRFQVNGLSIVCRMAKITPTKTGQFVTLWKRVTNGPIEPFEAADPIDLFVINLRMDDSFGQFVFPKEVLLSKGVISGNDKEGKRAMRVYASWDTAISKQAQRTQVWQSEFFISLSPEADIDHEKVRKRYLQD